MSPETRTVRVGNQHEQPFFCQAGLNAARIRGPDWSAAASGTLPCNGVTDLWGLIIPRRPNAFVPAAQVNFEAKRIK